MVQKQKFLPIALSTLLISFSFKFYYCFYNLFFKFMNQIKIDPCSIIFGKILCYSTLAQKYGLPDRI